MRIAGEAFILTVHHLFVDSVAKGGWGVIIPRRGEGVVHLAPTTHIKFDSLHDLAFIRLLPDNARELCDAGYEPASAAILHAPPDGPAAFGVVGYPLDFTTRAPGHLTVRPTLIAGFAPTDGRHLLAFDPQYEDAYEWPSLSSRSLTESDGSTIEAPDPEGLSGGGIWQACAADHEGWLPGDVRLAGIQHSWDRRSKIRATRTSAVVAFLKNVAPDLEAALKIVLLTHAAPRFVLVSGS